jgi:hypothetical protein
MIKQSTILAAGSLREEPWTSLHAVSIDLASGSDLAKVGAKEAKLVRLDVTYDGQMPISPSTSSTVAIDSGT